MLNMAESCDHRGALVNAQFAKGKHCIVSFCVYQCEEGLHVDIAESLKYASGNSNINSRHFLL